MDLINQELLNKLIEQQAYVKLRDGTKAKLLHRLTNPNDIRSAIIGIVHNYEGYELYVTWYPTGKWTSNDDDHANDIIGEWEEPFVINGKEMPEKPLTIEEIKDLSASTLIYYPFLIITEEGKPIFYQSLSKFYFNKNSLLKLVEYNFLFRTKEGAEAVGKELFENILANEQTSTIKED